MKHIFQKFIVLSLLFAVVACSGVQQQYAIGGWCDDKGKAGNEVLHVACQGDKQSQLLWGEVSELSGRYEHALFWYRHAFEDVKHQPKATFYLPNSGAPGGADYGNPLDIEYGNSKVVEKGDPVAAFFLFQLYYYGLGVPEERVQKGKLIKDFSDLLSRKDASFYYLNIAAKAKYAPAVEVYKALGLVNLSDHGGIGHYAENEENFTATIYHTEEARKIYDARISNVQK